MKKTSKKKATTKAAPKKAASKKAEGVTGEAPFARVHALVQKIPRGKVATYGQLSKMVD